MLSILSLWIPLIFANDLRVNERWSTVLFHFVVLLTYHFTNYSNLEKERSKISKGHYTTNGSIIPGKWNFDSRNNKLKFVP